MVLVLSYSCFVPIHWNQMFSQDWRCSWTNACMRGSNYIWVISIFIAYWATSYIRGLTVFSLCCFWTCGQLMCNQQYVKTDISISRRHHANTIFSDIFIFLFLGEYGFYVCQPSQGRVYQVNVPRPRQSGCHFFIFFYLLKHIYTG